MLISDNLAGDKSTLSVYDTLKNQIVYEKQENERVIEVQIMKHEEEAVIVVGCQYQKGGRDTGVKGKARIY